MGWVLSEVIDGNNERTPFGIRIAVEAHCQPGGEYPCRDRCACVSNTERAGSISLAALASWPKTTTRQAGEAFVSPQVCNSGDIAAPMQVDSSAPGWAAVIRSTAVDREARPGRKARSRPGRSRVRRRAPRASISRRIPASRPEEVESCAAKGPRGEDDAIDLQRFPARPARAQVAVMDGQSSPVKREPHGQISGETGGRRRGGKNCEWSIEK